MSIPLGIAPCSWGIEDITDKNNPSWERVMDEASRTGFSGIELGPYGFFPTEASRLKGILASKKLTLTAGTLYDDLSASADRAYLLNKTRSICSLLSQVEEDRAFLVIIDAVKPDRNLSAGHPASAKRLEAKPWKAMMDNVRAIARVARDEFGIRGVVHPHAGGYIEYQDETERVLHDIADSLVGLCLDTGHLYYAGSDPSESLIRFSSRLEYVHFKDIDRDVYKKALAEKLGFFDACKERVMCSIGKGCLDYGAIFRALESIGYQNWVTVEQERDPLDTAGVLDDLAASYAFLLAAMHKG